MQQARSPVTCLFPEISGLYRGEWGFFRAWFEQQDVEVLHLISYRLLDTCRKLLILPRLVPSTVTPLCAFEKMEKTGVVI